MSPESSRYGNKRMSKGAPGVIVGTGTLVLVGLVPADVVVGVAGRMVQGTVTTYGTPSTARTVSTISNVPGGVFNGAVPVMLCGSPRLKKPNGVAVTPMRISLGLRRYSKVEKSKGTPGVMVSVGRLVAVGAEGETGSTGVVALLMIPALGIRVNGMVTVYGGSNTPSTVNVTWKTMAAESFGAVPIIFGPDGPVEFPSIPIQGKAGCEAKFSRTPPRLRK